MSDKIKTMGSREIEHTQNQNGGLARKSSVPKKSDTPSPIHPHMANRTNTTIGAPPTGSAPDASSSNVTAPSRQGKAFPIPKIAFGHKSTDHSTFDPALAESVMNEAMRSPDDFARNLHTVLPGTIKEDCAPPVRKP